jgi:importin subunit alpha-6/7
LLSHEKRAVRREACWTISNITAGSPDHIALVVANPLYIEKLITLMNTDSAEVNENFKN